MIRVIRQSEWPANHTDAYRTADKYEKTAMFAQYVRHEIMGRSATYWHQDANANANAAATAASVDALIDRSARLIIRAVQSNGDAAVYKYEKRFGGIRSARVPLLLSAGEIKAAYDAVTRPQYDAIRMAAGRLIATEKATVRSIHMSDEIKVNAESDTADIIHHNDNVITTTKMKNVKPDASPPDTFMTVRRFVPLRSVGCYVPGGLARYPSSAIMSITPAAIAGVPRIAVMCPVVPGTIMPDPLTIVAADTCGATEMYRVGGAHAIAALAYGTQSIKPVDKIVGPGGPYVTAAKAAVSAHVGIDMLAGPTELGIIADSQASARLVALDLISQAEHSADTQCYLITTSERLAAGVSECISGMLKEKQQKQRILRHDTIHASITQNGFVLVLKDMDSAIHVADALAPEHLQIMTRDPERIAQRLTTPGMILLGSQSPSAASDYLLGSNHVLPTGGSGATRGSLSVLDFVKLVTTAKATRGALHEIDDAMREIATAEGLYNHYEAVRGRL